jgi:1-acyl-sn-glycerol-3-phosphate acyltransferase
MNFLRSVLHVLFLAITVVPFALAVMLVSLLGRRDWVYKTAVSWLTLSTKAGRWFLGIEHHVTGLENLPTGNTSPAVLLVKHQSVWETFAMPGIMPHPLAYVFKKELLRIPFFGWSMACMDMVHIDRSQRTQAFNKIVAQGSRLLDKGTWIIMFPEGTRIARGEVGTYKEGGARLAVATGAPVIPIAVTSGKVWPRKAFIKTPGRVDISIGKPIPSVGREPAELMLEVKTWIEAEMQRLDPEAYKKASSALS